MAVYRGDALLYWYGLWGATQGKDAPDTLKYLGAAFIKVKQTIAAIHYANNLRAMADDGAFDHTANDRVKPRAIAASG